ncbi:hypothetical protein [Burkholderia cepacia]|uniref:hypothetical protein n=1 Tax=Burkholderia cepacia TaxID=292 RepID=UPI002ABE1B41|nr:hypothetical protein [Burkholderia cepacia]
MALDPNISLQVQPVQVQNPLTQYAQFASAQGAQRQNQLLDLAIQDKQRETAQAQALNDAFKAPGAVNADGTLNASGIVGNVASSGYGAAVPGLAKSLAETQSAQLAQQKASVEGALQKVGAVGQVLGGVSDQASLDLARQWVTQHVGADAAANMPGTYDPTAIANLQQKGLTVMQQLDQHNKAIDQQLAQAQFGETQRHNLASEGIETRAQNMRANEYDPNSGMIINKATGQAMPAMNANGQPIGPKTQQPTEYQSQSAVYGARALSADRVMSDLAGKYSPQAVNLAAATSDIPLLGTLVNKRSSENTQRVEQAQRDFVNAVLRRESGASIAPGEFSNAQRQYFPQPGDSEAVIAQKAANRQTVIEGLRRGSGNAWYEPNGMQTATHTQPGVSGLQPQAMSGANGVPAIPSGTIKADGGKSYQFDGHGWLEVQ